MVILLFALFAVASPRLKGAGRVAIGGPVALFLVFSGWLHGDDGARMGFSLPRGPRALRLAAILLLWGLGAALLPALARGFPPGTEVADRGRAELLGAVLLRYPLAAAFVQFALLSVVSNRLREASGSDRPVPAAVGLLLGLLHSGSLAAAIVFGLLGLLAAAFFRRVRSLLPPVAAHALVLAAARLAWPAAWRGAFPF